MKTNKTYAALSIMTGAAFIALTVGTLGFAQSATTTGPLTCSPATQNVTLGQTATFSATGGNGSYTWSSPNLTIINATGSGFSASYASTGTKVMTVSSAGATATCVTNVMAGNPVPTPVPVTTPGLPDTGGGYGQQ